MFKRNALKFAGLAWATVLLMISCDLVNPPDDEPKVDDPADIAVAVIITEGPADGAAILYSSSPTFRWKGEVRPGYVSGFQWFQSVDGDTTENDWNMDMAVTFPNLTDGEYIFGVRAMTAEDTSAWTATSFTVGPADSVNVPLVRWISNPTDGSFRPPGASISFEWAASSAAAFGYIAGYRYRLSGTGASTTSWTSWNLNTTTAAFSDLSNGTYTFQVAAMDNASTIGDTAEIAITVKDATILVVDDYDPGSFLDEVATDKIFAEILRDWAVEEWDVESKGAPPTAAELAAGNYTTVVWYIDEGAASFGSFHLEPDSTGYIDNPLPNFLDNGGNLWLMGGELLYNAAGAYTEWGDFAETDEAIATADTVTVPISASLDNNGYIDSTLALTISISATGIITFDTTDVITFDTTTVDTGDVITADTSDVITADTAWTTIGGPWVENVTDAAEGDLLNAAGDTLGSVSSGGTITIDSLSVVDLSGVDLAVLSMTATAYNHKHQYEDMFAAGTFIGDYLHITDGGDAAADYTGLLAVDDSSRFTDIGIPGLATGTGWPDEIVPDTDAGTQVIYELLGDGAESTTGILYEGTYNVVFWAVHPAFVATNGNHLTLAPDDMYPVVNTIMGIFGE